MLGAFFAQVAGMALPLPCCKSYCHLRHLMPRAPRHRSLTYRFKVAAPGLAFPPSLSHGACSCNFQGALEI